MKVCAASINPLDWHFMRGTPYLLRLMTGLRKPKVPRLGVDTAGRVEAAGRNVTQFRVGDEVFGMCNGALAEYACGSEKALGPEADQPVLRTGCGRADRGPDRPSRATGQLQPGQRVLVNGAAGGVGTFAVQMAKVSGAEVTGVCSARNVDLVRTLGADHVIDYTREDFTQGGQRYDLIFDAAGTHSLSATRRALASNGTLVMVGGVEMGNWIEPFLAPLQALILSRFVGQSLVPFLAKRNQEDLNTLKALLETGKVTPVIDRSYPLSEAPEAIRYLEAGHARGKVIITVPQAPTA